MWPIYKGLLIPTLQLAKREQAFADELEVLASRSLIVAARDCLASLHLRPVGSHYQQTACTDVQDIEQADLLAMGTRRRPKSYRMQVLRVPTVQTNSY